MADGPPFHQDAPDAHLSQAPSSPQDAVVREDSTYMSDPRAAKFCQTFATGLHSGIGYARILDILARQDFDPKIVSRLREAILERGDMLAEALARFGLLDPSARKLVLVAEEQGVLPETFSTLSDIYDKRYKQKKVFGKAMVEPVLLVALGGIAFSLIRSNLVELTFSDNTKEQIYDILIMAGIQSALFGLAAFSVFGLWLYLPVDFAPRDAFARVWMRIPFLSAPKQLFAISLFCHYLQQSIESGMTVMQGLELAAEASNHPGILSDYPKAQGRIEQGHSLAQALNAIRALPAEVLEMVDIGESAGMLDERLRDMAESYEERAEEVFEDRRRVYAYLMRMGVMILVVSGVFMGVLSLEMF
jgi:type IV pilus assembly protein PilC